MHIHNKIRKDSDLFTNADSIDEVITHAPYEAIGLFEQVFKLGSLNHRLIAYRVCLKREIKFPTDFTNKLYLYKSHF